ncbi:MAG TPA: circularly permuted type 2 ATP-grasp protein, partial [Burkholderiales bacterium]|nr:circularly permuted type 2 ATP-grasp protein [Burkholderiales bacterium]
MPAKRLQGYERAVGFDEAVAPDGDPRSHYSAVFEELDRLTPAELSSRERLRDALFRRLGITFAVYGDATGQERTWPMDLVPRILPAAEWAEVERGLAQRIKVLNLFLEDLYVGERAAVRDGIVPAWLVYSSEG